MNISNFAHVTGMETALSSKQRHAGSSPVVGAILALTLVLNGCATISDNPKEISGITTFHPSERTTLFFVCERYYRKDDVKQQHEHVHCDKDRLINFKFLF